MICEHSVDCPHCRVKSSLPAGQRLRWDALSIAQAYAPRTAAWRDITKGADEILKRMRVKPRLVTPA